MKRGISATLLFGLIALLFTACGGGTGSSNTSSNNSQQSGSVFVAAEDTPLPAVLAFNVTINSITLSNSSTSVQVLAQPTTVDFARLLGLRTLLGFNTVPPGTYTLHAWHESGATTVQQVHVAAGDNTLTLSLTRE